MQSQIEPGTLVQLCPPVNTYRVESLKDGVYKTTVMEYVGEENIGHASSVYAKGQTCFISAHRLYVAPPKIEVYKYGPLQDHQAQAYMADGTVVTFYVNAGVVSTHCPYRGGLGCCKPSEFADPELLEQLRGAYHAAV